MCKRAFPVARPTAIRELAGGEFNTTYKITLTGVRGDQEHVVLRVAPGDTAAVSRSERLLMRKAHNAQPYLAPIAPLIPGTIMTDFTRHIVDRDYVFQSLVEGELWSDARGALSDAQDAALWEQMGGIAKTIHAVRGEAFGEPYPGQQFPTWSQAILHNLADTSADAVDCGLDTRDLRAIADSARAHCNVLDEVTESRLLHGDLWPFNILIRRQGDEARIVAVLDADYAWWGDPLADWTMHQRVRPLAPDCAFVVVTSFGLALDPVRPCTGTSMNSRRNGMPSTIHSITFDCAEPVQLAHFWAAALGYTVGEWDEEFAEVLPPEGQAGHSLRLLFVVVPEDKTAKNRMHLDLRPAEHMTSEVERLVALGAHKIREYDVPHGHWTLMHDPEGNEFCLERGTADP